MRPVAWLGLGVGAALLLAGCFDFDDAWRTYCKTSDCSTPRNDAGLGATHDAGSDDGGEVDAGAPTDAGDSDAGASDAGAPACLGFGATCSVEGQCCDTSDAGLPMACSRNNWCQDTARDCRNDGFTCSRDEQCCNGVCSEGRCALSSTANGPCENGRQCAPYANYSCAFDGGAVGKCTSAKDAGSGCASAAFCGSGFCATPGADASVFAATCQVATACTPLRQSPTDAGCCEGLVEAGDADDADAGLAKCLLPDDAWCNADSDCASRSCYGFRCRTGQPGRGERCDGTSNCVGITNYCDPVNGLCMNRWCLPATYNAHAGCCTIAGPGPYLCSFPDAGGCFLAGFRTSNPAECCSGRTYPFNGSTYCDQVQLF